MCEGSRNLRIQVQTKTVHSNTCQDFMCLSFKIAYQDSRQQTKQNCLSATWLYPKNNLTASHPWKRNHFPGERFLRGVMMPSCKIFPWLSPDHSSYFGSQNLPQKPSSNFLNKRNMQQAVQAVKLLNFLFTESLPSRKHLHLRALRLR